MKLEELQLRSLISDDFIFHYSNEHWGEDMYIMKKDGLAMCRVYMFHDNQRELFISELSVDPLIRQSGWGTKLIETFHLIAKESNREFTYLFVDKNSWMYNWYSKMGYSYHSEYHDAEENFIWVKRKVT